MNVIWSSHVQGIRTLYDSRKLRFDDRFAEQYKALFQLDGNVSLKLLEIGCGPGALAEVLHHWYPKTRITALDRDSAFVQFAKSKEHGVTFLEGDATALPFGNNSFDVTVSNTVSEHVEPSKFFGEQLRVLKPGGVCLVLSSRKGIHIPAKCLADSEYEQAFWEKVARFDDSMEKYGVCKYPMSEAQLPEAMERYGFHDVQTGYVTVDLTPDDPKVSPHMALTMIEAQRSNDLDALASVKNTIPEQGTDAELAQMRRLINAKYDLRLAQYARGEKQWDTSVSVIMAVRGKK